MISRKTPSGLNIKNVRNNQAGFGLIEVVVGMFLLSILLVGMMGFTNAFLTGQKRQQQMVHGMNAGQDVMEYYRGYLRDTTQIDSLRNVVNLNGSAELPEQMRIVQNTQYKVKGRLVSAGIDGKTLKLTSSVFWVKGKKTDTVKVALNTYIRRRS